MIPNPESLDQGLIVSVQAPQGSPMRDPDVIAAMADAALRNGAVASIAITSAPADQTA